MSGYPWLLWLHIVAACTWTGGMILFAFLLPALARAGADDTMIRAGVRVFARVSWTALAVLVVTGLGQIHVLHLGLGHRPLAIKIVLVAALVLVTGVHQVRARRSSPVARRLLEIAVVLLTLAVVRQALEI